MNELNKRKKAASHIERFIKNDLRET